MVGLVVVSHSARLAAGVAELAREMGGEARIETAGGLEPPEEGAEAPLGTDAARVMAAIEAADDGSGDGVLVLMDLGSAVLSAEMAVELLDPEIGERVRLAAAPLVEGAVAAAVAAAGGATLDAVAAEALGGLAGKVAHLGEEADAPEPAPDALPAAAPRADAPPPPRPTPDDRGSGSLPGTQIRSHPPETVEERFVVTVAQGLHARPAARFVRTAAALSAQIEVENATTGAGPAPAGSLNAIATLGVREGHELIVRASGPDAHEAVRRLRDVATEGGGDSAAPPAAPEPSATTAGATAPLDDRRSAAVEQQQTDAAAAPLDAAPARLPGAPETGAPAPARPVPPGAPAGALVGIASSPGIAIGPLRPLGGAAADEEPPIAEEPSGPPAEEWAALERARASVSEEIEQRRERLAEAVGAEEAEILDALALVLDDEALLRPAREAIDAGGSAARAWTDAVEAIAARYRALEDPYQRERAADLLDVGRRVLRALAGAPGANRGATDANRGATDANRGAPGANRGATDANAGTVDPNADTADPNHGAGDTRTPAIVVARDLTPIDAAGLDRATVAGIATAEGGPTSHGAILARALGVPAVLGLGSALLDLVANAAPAPAILDGDAGLLVPDADQATRDDYDVRRRQAAERAEQARAHAHEPATTRDGTTIEVAANAGSTEDAREARRAGADGIGLFRTEFAFLERAQAPTEDEQHTIYAAAADALEREHVSDADATDPRQRRPLVIRTLDAGADKPLPYLGMPPEANPFLGVRGLRLGLARPDLLRTQLRAIVRTAARHDDIKLMFPMVATIDELRAARALLDEAIAAEAARAGARPGGEGERAAEAAPTPRPSFEVGIMIEVPAAALTANQLAREVDFFSIGTNDLTQYVLAAERGNAALAQLADGLHPAVLRLIDEVCRAAHAHGRWVGVCGELAADPLAVPLLVGLGVRELSVAAPAVASVKQAVRELDLDDAVDLARAALAAESADAVRTLVVSAGDRPGRRPGTEPD